MSSSKQNREIRNELNNILTRDRVSFIAGKGINESSEDYLDVNRERKNLIEDIKNFKSRFNLEKLPVRKQKGLKGFLKKLNDLSNKKDEELTLDDLSSFGKAAENYLDVSQVPAMEMEESKEEEKEEVKEEKEESKEESKEEADVMEAIKQAQEDIDSGAYKNNSPAPTPVSTPPQSPRTAPAPAPAPAPTPAVATPMETREETPEEKPIEDISTEQVVEIPAERKGTDGKSTQQLDADIKFFLSKYPSLLKEEASFYKKMKKTKRNLVELHRRIEAKLAPVEKKQPQTIGVIVDADKYIDERIKALLVEKTMTGLKPADLVVDVSEPEDKSIQRKGSYVLSKGRSGRLAIERAPVYRNIPTTNPQPKARPYQDVSMLKSQRWDLTNTAKKHVLSDPFIEPQPNKRINILL